MAKIAPLKPHFQDVRSLLARVAEDADTIRSVVFVVNTKDGDSALYHFEATLGDLAFAAALCQERFQTWKNG